MRYLLDTNAVGDFINHRHGVTERTREARLGGAIVGTSEPVVAELFFGIENSATRDENLKRLRQGLTRIWCWPLDRRASEEFGRLAVVMKRTGRVIGPIDLMTAAIALSLGECIIVTNDKDFLTIPGIVVENWRTETEGAVGS
jgi:tRNA(fMet)-specific endonuclease VapC